MLLLVTSYLVSQRATCCFAESGSAFVNWELNVPEESHIVQDGGGGTFWWWACFGDCRKCNIQGLHYFDPLLPVVWSFLFFCLSALQQAAAVCPTVFVRFVTLSFFPVRMHSVSLLGHTIFSAAQSKETLWTSIYDYILAWRLYTGLVTSNNSVTALQSCCQQGIESCYLCLIIPLFSSHSLHIAYFGIYVHEISHYLLFNSLFLLLDWQGIESCYLCLIIPLFSTLATHCIFCIFAYICMR